MKMFDRIDLDNLICFVEENKIKIAILIILIILFFWYMIRVNFFIERDPHWEQAVRIECNVGDNKWAFEPAYAANAYVSDDRIFFFYRGEYIQIKPLHICNITLIERGKYPKHFFNYYGEIIEK